MKTRSFTLLELMMVVAIIAIILLIAIPSLRSLQSTGLQAATRQVSSDLSLARQRSVTYRKPVRFLIPVETNHLEWAGSGWTNKPNHDLVCRAYLICEATNDPEGTLVGWVAVQDWSYLPVGIVFSDVNCRNYDLVNANPMPPALATNRLLGASASASTAWRYLDCTNEHTVYMPGLTSRWTTTVVEFRPSGYVWAASSIPSGPAAGIRLAPGAVLDPGGLQLLVSDTNNWAYIEYDAYSGRVRTRYRDSYQ